MAPMKRPNPHKSLQKSHSLTHLAHRWGLKQRDVKELLRTGELPFVEFKGQLRVPSSAVEKYERQ